MDFCPTLYIIGDYFTKALQGSQLRCFCNIILDIHEDDIPSYNEYVREFLEYQNIKIEKEKEEAHKYAKLEGN